MQGWCSGESTRLPSMWPRFKSRCRCHNVGWVCFWFSSLLWEVFLRLLQFCPLFKNRHFQVSIRQVIRLIKNHYVYVLALNRYLIYLFKFQTMYFYTCTLCPNHSLGLPSSSGIFSASTEKSVRMSCNMNSFNKNELHRICRFFSTTVHAHRLYEQMLKRLIDPNFFTWRDNVPLMVTTTAFLSWSTQTKNGVWNN